MGTLRGIAGWELFVSKPVKKINKQMEEKENKVSTKKCKFCVSDIPTEAKRCPQCHADLRLWRQRHPVLLTFLIIGFIWISGSILSYAKNLSDKMSKQIDNSIGASEPLLEVESVRYTKGRNFATAEGEVKNISSQALKQVTVVGMWYDKNNNLITSDEVLIKFNPILPGQTSPFSVSSTINPEMVSGNIDFKYLTGGTIPTKSAEDK